MLNTRKAATINELKVSALTGSEPISAERVRSKSATQVPLTKVSGVGKNSAKYWMDRIYKPVNANGSASPHYMMRVKFRGKRLAFSLGTAKQAEGASLAAGIYHDLLTLGVEGTLAKHRPKPEKADRPATVGEWIAAASEVSEANPSTFNCYACSLRKIVGDILAVKRTKKRFGPRTGGAAAYRAKINSASLAMLKPEAVQKWRLSYVKKAKNPAQERSRMTSCNSTIRQARSLFAAKVVRFLPELRLPEPAPFAGIEFFPRQNNKYFSRIDAKALLQKAAADLSRSDPPAFTAMLLAISAGLRRGEIDSLTWGQIDFGRQLIRVEVTEKAGLKTADSRAEVPIDDSVAALLRGQFARIKKLNAFVIEGEGSVGGQKKWGQHYRADAAFSRAITWLRSHGVTARKPLHELRKELGALVTAEHGIYAASRVMRHSNVATTAAHYTDLKTRPVVNVGAWLTESEGALESPEGEKPATPKKKRGGRAKAPSKRLTRF
jgi:integrase